MVASKDPVAIVLARVVFTPTQLPSPLSTVQGDERKQRMMQRDYERAPHDIRSVLLQRLVELSYTVLDSSEQLSKRLGTAPDVEAQKLLPEKEESNVPV